MPISDRIRIARQHAGLSKAELARRLGVTRAPLTAWEDGSYEPSRANAKALAAALNVDPSWLLYGIGAMLADNQPIGEGSIVPRVDMQNLLEFLNNSRTAAEFTRSHFPCSSQAFATSIEDDANAPQFLPGHKIVIDPAEQPRPGDMVLALSKDDFPIFARWTASGLEYLNPDWRTPDKIPLSSIRLVGVMMEHAAPRKRL